LIPLEEILAEIYQVGAGTKRVAESYNLLLRRYGSECDILRTVPRADLDRSPVGLLGEAIERMRNGSIHFKPGFDGVYGRVRIFEEHERNELRGQITLFPVCGPNPPPAPEHQIMEERPGGRVPGAPVMLNAPSPEPGFVLNAEQQSVVDHPGGPLLIAAGPGTGKTRTITSRMAFLMVTRGVQAPRILAVTFTNKAAREILNRLAAQLPPGSQRPLATTFHGLCRKLLLERGADYAAAVMDDEGRLAVMADALKEVSSGSAMKMPIAAAVSAVIRAKQLLLAHGDDLSGLYKAPRPGQPQLLRQAYCAYQNLLKLQNTCDFEDLIFDIVHHLESDDAFRHSLRQRFTHIFVDEFQDINYGQYRLIRLLAPPEADICVIGDPDQSIYGFRGSDAAFFKQFQTDYPQAPTVRLKRNYRSTGTILQAAYQVVHAGRGCEERPIPVHTETHEESFVSILEAPSPLAEAVAIGQTIEQMVGGSGFQAQDFGKITQEKEECSFADFAILYRTSEQGQLLADVLTRAGIPCQLACRRRAGRKAESVKLLALLRTIADQGSYTDMDQLNDLIVPGVSRESLGMFKAWACETRQAPVQAMQAAARVPIPGMSLARQQRLTALIKAVHSIKAGCAGRSIPQIIELCLAQTTLAGRIDGEDLESLLRRAADFDRDLTAFLAEMAFQRDTDLYEKAVEKVALMTLHASKGLEFNIVFVAGCEEGLLPHRYPGTAAADPEEERRLFFVGMTRARRRLFLTWSRKRAIRGKMSSRQRSPFVDHIEGRLKRIITQQRSSSPQKQLSLF
jgi:DNA helicase II / ATP-dependent DNA helicase PcrA